MQRNLTQGNWFIIILNCSLLVESAAILIGQNY